MKYSANIIRILFLSLFILLLVNGKIMLWLELFGASLIAALIFGRVYCGYICPMNTLMIPVERLSEKLMIQTGNTPGWLKNGYFSWITLAVSAVAMLFSKSMLHINLPILPFWIVISVLVTLRYKPAVFHNLICPFGALQKTFGRFTQLSKRVERGFCIGCRLCENVCPSGAITVIRADRKAVINSALCHQCTNCRKICPESAISYRKLIEGKAPALKD